MSLVGALLRRLAHLVAVLATVLVLAFALIQAAPGDPALLLAGPVAVPADLDRLRGELGQETALALRLAAWAGRAVQGDIGRSLVHGRPVAGLLRERAAVTAWLVGTSFGLALGLGCLGGWAAASRVGGRLDRGLAAATVLAMSLPSFTLALLLTLLVALSGGWLPTAGWIDPLVDPVGGLRSLALPAIALALAQLALIQRLSRAAWLAAGQPWVQTAQANGRSLAAARRHHVLPHGWPTIGVSAVMALSALLSGAVVIEALFAVPGLGLLVAGAVAAGDFPVVMGALLVLAPILALAQAAADTAQRWQDPSLALPIAR